jgi:hypothetical protein
MDPIALCPGDLSTVALVDCFAVAVVELALGVVALGNPIGIRDMGLDWT